MKALLHVQHLLGIGHAVRAAAIGRALRDRQVEVTLATGNHLPQIIDTDGLSVVNLPAARAADASFSTLLDDSGTPIDETWKAARTEQLLALHDKVAPDILLTEFFPLGRRKFRFELIPLLQQARKQAPRPLIASAVRDILVAKDDASAERWMADTALEYYDRLLVHGDPEFVRLGETFRYADDLADITSYTGYVHGGANVPEPPAGDGDGEIIVACGGGIVGETILRAALAVATSRRGQPWRWRILAGRDLPQAIFDDLAAKAGGKIILEPARPDFPKLLQRARLVICQAGYNSVMDILAAGISGVLVPFAQGRESEQTVRAQALARENRMIMAPEAGLTAARLSDAVAKAMQLPARWPPAALDGAAKSADILIGLAMSRSQ